MTELLASALLFTLLLWLACALICAGVYPRLRTRLYLLDPAQSTNYLLAFMSLPALCALGSALLLYWPDVAGQLVSTHCHAGACGGHGPVLEQATLPAAVLLLWYATRLANTAWRHWWPGLLLARQLRATGEAHGEVVELNAAQPAAFTVGWWRPTIFLSRGLLEKCSGRDVACILAHERSHKRRRDNLRLLAAMVLTAPLPPGVSRRQIEDLNLLHELAADRGAAGDCGFEAVAAALLRVARLQNTPPPHGCAAFAGNATVLRIERLLNSPAPARLPLACSVALGLAATAAIVALINPLHTLMESLSPLL